MLQSPPTPPPAQEEEPIWVRREREREMNKDGGPGIPFGVYLLLSSFVAIAAVRALPCYMRRCSFLGSTRELNTAG